MLNTFDCCIIIIQCVQKKRDQKYSIRNVNKFARIAIISGKRRRECTGKLLVERKLRTPRSPNQCSYFTLQMKRSLWGLLLHHSARTDSYARTKRPVQIAHLQQQKSQTVYNGSLDKKDNTGVNTVLNTGVNTRVNTGDNT